MEGEIKPLQSVRRGPTPEEGSDRSWRRRVHGAAAALGRAAGDPAGGRRLRGTMPLCKNLRSTQAARPAEQVHYRGMLGAGPVGKRP